MEAIPLQSRDREKRAVGRALRIALIGSVALAAVLLALLVGATSNTRLIERHYDWLILATGALAIGLLGLVLELVRRLVRRWRAGLFGTRLMARLAWAFTLMTAIPCLLIYLVSVQFVGRSIESWFDLPLERALESGLSLGRATLDASLADLVAKARRFDVVLSDLPPSQWQGELDRLRDQTGVREAVIVTGAGRVVASTGTEYARLLPELPPAAALKQARLTRQYAAVETGDGGDDAGSRPGAGAPVAERGLQLRVVRQLSGGVSLADEPRYLQLLQPVPPAQANDAETVLAAQRDYQILKESRRGLKNLFVVALTLALVLTLFAALAASFLLAGWLTGPLSMLAAATRAVAEGDYRPVKDYAGRDELGVLTQSFNAMTRQLDEARAQVERNRAALEGSRAQLERVLSNLTAGVFAFDAQFRLLLSNDGARRIFGVAFDTSAGTPLESLPRLGALAPALRAAFDEAVAGDEDHPTWQRQFELPRAQSGEAGVSGLQTLLARGARLPGGPDGGDGWLLVVDDISDVVSAQRSVAWGEVARRLAHEIKNPLTPIQLAAERMEHKLAPKLPPHEAELLHRNARTIVSQVAAMKHMVDEFREYARLPSARLAPLDLNALAGEVLTLYGGMEHAVPIETALQPGLPLIAGDATQLRQVIHNLLQNAQEALERMDAPRVRLQTELVSPRPGVRAVRLVVTDNGPGFAPEQLARAFEPYVTTKARGTGLGLAIVRKIVDEHGARIEVTNGPPAAAGGKGGATVEAARTEGEGTRVAVSAPGRPGATVTIVFTKLAESADNRAALARG